MSPHPRRSDSGPSLEACAGVVVGLTFAYLIAESAVVGPLHPVHWGLALVGAALGYLAGQAVHRFRNGESPWGGTRRRR
jgi:F0F1-type ATP synthase assembly protein I